ncbi:hypothetical protein SCUP515_02775 [Seiridium cupressi]
MDPCTFKVAVSGPDLQTQHMARAAPNFLELQSWNSSVHSLPALGLIDQPIGSSVSRLIEDEHSDGIDHRAQPGCRDKGDKKAEKEEATAEARTQLSARARRKDLDIQQLRQRFDRVLAQPCVKGPLSTKSPYLSKAATPRASHTPTNGPRQQLTLSKVNKALRQIPFNGKKLKPAKIRKDYWRPMAMIQFPEGMGHIGRSVFHIMREFKMQHDLAWGDALLRDDETNRTLTRHERGEKLNEVQRANAIADMAAVLGGAGKGNKMWLPVMEGMESLVETSGETRADEETGSTAGLLRTNIFWANELDKNFAMEWPANVSHNLFSEAVSVRTDQPEDDTVQIAPAEVVATEEAPKKTSWFSR